MPAELPPTPEAPSLAAPEDPLPTSPGVPAGRRCQVAVVGAGPTGLFLAAALAARGVDVVVLERRTEPPEHSRGIGLHPPALAALAAVGLDEAAIAAGVPVRAGLGLSGGRLLGELNFDRPGAAYPFILVLPQHRTEALLAGRLAELAPTAVQRGVEVVGLDGPREGQPDGPVQLSGRTADGAQRCWEADVVVGADGTRSRVRELAGIGERSRAWPDTYLMGDVPDTTDDGPVARIDLHPAGVVESFPLPGGLRRWVVHTGPHRLAEESGVLARLVAARTGDRLEAAAASMVSAFGVRRVLAERMLAGRTVLLGDAAHAISPFGGQGMSLGWLDALELVPYLERAVSAGVPVAQLPGAEDVAGRRLQVAAAAARQAEVNMVLGRALPRPLRASRDVAARALMKTPAREALAWTYSMGWARVPPMASAGSGGVGPHRSPTPVERSERGLLGSVMTRVRARGSR